MSRFAATFERLRARGERALMPYIMAGDPSLEETRRLLLEAEKRGADAVELGVPFSDPLADGPVVQRAGLRALASGTTLPRVLELVATLRAQVSLPIALMTYYNPVFVFGLKGFARAAVDAGVDGLIVPDLPYDESGPLRAEAEPAGLDLVQFVAPTSTPARVKAIARPPDLAAQVRTLRLVTTKPLCVGFGVSTPEQAAAVGKLADGVLVGSAIVRLIERHAGTPELVHEFGSFIESLKAPLRR